MHNSGVCMKVPFLILGLTCLLLAGQAFAETQTQAQAQTQAENQKQDPSASSEDRVKVKKRLYPGGRDEEPLLVQTQLPVAGRAGTVADEPADPADHD